MPKYIVRAEYSETVWYRSDVEIEAVSEADAIATVRHDDKEGWITFYDFNIDSGDLTLTIEQTITSPEQDALDAMTAEYLAA